MILILISGIVGTVVFVCGMYVAQDLITKTEDREREFAFRVGNIENQETNLPIEQENTGDIIEQTSTEQGGNEDIPPANREDLMGG